MTMSTEERVELLQTLRSDAGQAEASGGRTAANYFPVVEHLRALEADVVLIVGDRGAGKSQLVRVATSEQLRSSATVFARGLRLPEGKCDWQPGFPIKDGPTADLLQRFVASQRDRARTVTQELWCAYLVRALGGELPDTAREIIRPLCEGPGPEVEKRHADLLRADSFVLTALDDLDKKLTREGRWIFVSYDELDTLYYSDRWSMGELIRGLVSFWANRTRRWARIRPKIFLRTDFYRHHSEGISSADMAKIAATRVDLTWSDRNLYAAWIKHIANLNEAWFRYCQKGKAGALRFRDDPQLGHVPLLQKKEDAKPLVDRIVGPFMGASEKKGQSFSWILEHLRDGNGRVSPRSLVLLFERAALEELDRPRATGVQVLSPTSLRNALDKVSEAHVTQVVDEFSWLPAVKERLRGVSLVPWESRRTLEKALEADWNAWQTADKDVRPPADSAKALVDLLLEVGIVRERRSGALDAPDLYLAGLRLYRKGGVERGNRRSAV